MQPRSIFSPWYSVKHGKLSELIHRDLGFENQPSRYTKCWGFSLPSSYLRVLGQESGPEEGGECWVCSSHGQKIPSSAPLTPI